MRFPSVVFGLFGVGFEIVILAVRDAHQLVPLFVLVLAFGEKAIHYIDRPLGVMGQFVGRLLVKREIFGQDAECAEPRLKTVDPFLMDPRSVFGPNKILHLHLLKLARAKDKIARRHLVAKRLADLGDTKRQLSARCIQNILEIDKNSLRGFGPRDMRGPFGSSSASGTDRGTKHQIEWLRSVSPRSTVATFDFSRFELIKGMF